MNFFVRSRGSIFKYFWKNLRIQNLSEGWSENKYLIYVVFVPHFNPNKTVHM
jgi:hypothetical protein